MRLAAGDFPHAVCYGWRNEVADCQPLRAWSHRLWSPNLAVGVLLASGLELAMLLTPLPALLRYPTHGVVCCRHLHSASRLRRGARPSDEVVGSAVTLAVADG